MTEADLRTAIDQRGWRQGSLLPASLNERIRFADGDAVLPADAIAVLITQDCDVLARRPDDEPVVEIVVGTPVTGLDPNNTYGKNPRRLDLELTNAANWSRGAARLEMRLRGSIPRALLAEVSPNGRVANGE